MALDTSTATVLGAVVGAGTSAFIGFLTRWLDRREEHRRQFRLLAVQAGLDTWKALTEARAKTNETALYPDPLNVPDQYIAHMIRVIDAAADTSLSTQEAAAKAGSFHIPREPYGG